MINFDETQTWPDRPVDFMTASKYPLRDADGTIIGTFGLSSDITRRVLAEAASRRTARRSRPPTLELRRGRVRAGDLLEVSPDAMVKLDRDLRHVYVNPMAAEVIETPHRGDPRPHQPGAGAGPPAACLVG
jgi:PAS domain-containing protein